MLHGEGIVGLAPSEKTMMAMALLAPSTSGDAEGKRSANCIDKDKACSIETSLVSILQRFNCIKVDCNTLDFAQKDFAQALIWNIAAPAERVFRRLLPNRLRREAAENDSETFRGDNREK